MWIEVLKRRYRYRKNEAGNYESYEIWVEAKVWVGKRKYQKKAHHKKKVKSEKQLAKEAWRKHKGVDRDKAKRQDLHGYHSDGCPVWLKRHCNKKHRQWERRCIEKGNYERLGAKYKRKDIYDPWMWD